MLFKIKLCSETISEATNPLGISFFILTPEFSIDTFQQRRDVRHSNATWRRIGPLFINAYIIFYQFIWDILDLFYLIKRYISSYNFNKLKPAVVKQTYSIRVLVVRVCLDYTQVVEYMRRVTCRIQVTTYTASCRHAMFIYSFWNNTHIINCAVYSLKLLVLNTVALFFNK